MPNLDFQEALMSEMTSAEETEGDRWCAAVQKCESSVLSLTYPMLDAVGNDMFQSSVHQI